MALNLSTLTSPATSGDVLAEALTTADFLEGVPVLRNLARGSQKGGDAKQDVALNQPKALPLIDGKGYCYLPVTTGNAPAVTFPTIGASDDFVFEMVAYVVNSDDFHITSGANGNNRFYVNFLFNTHFFDGYTQIPMTQLSSGLSTLTVERSSSLNKMELLKLVFQIIRVATISAIFLLMVSFPRAVCHSTATSRPPLYPSKALRYSTVTSRPPTSAITTPSSNARLAKW